MLLAGAGKINRDVPGDCKLEEDERLDNTRLIHLSPNYKFHNITDIQTTISTSPGTSLRQSSSLSPILSLITIFVVLFIRTLQR
jgi:preprotein translocase subunit SecF